MGSLIAELEASASPWKMNLDWLPCDVRPWGWFYELLLWQLQSTYFTVMHDTQMSACFWKESIMCRPLMSKVTSLQFSWNAEKPLLPSSVNQGFPQENVNMWLPYFLWFLPMPFTHPAHHLHRKRLDEETAVGWEDPVLLLTSPYSPALLRWAAHPLFNITLPLTLIILFWTHICAPGGFPGGKRTCVKEPNCQCRKPNRAWVRKIPWRRAWQPTPVFLPGESHGQRGLEGYSPWSHKQSDTIERPIFSFSFFSNLFLVICISHQIVLIMITIHLWSIKNLYNNIEICCSPQL